MPEQVEVNTYSPSELLRNLSPLSALALSCVRLSRSGVYRETFVA